MRHGEGARYAKNNIAQVAEQFASDLSEQARERFGEGRELLQRVKDRLRAFSTEVLHHQLDTAASRNVVRNIAANYSGKWRWEVIFYLEDTHEVSDDNVQLIFGPSAWHMTQVAPDLVPNPDYSRIFIWRHSTKEFRQSGVTLQEVLDGLDREDTRLRDEILDLLGDDH